MVKAIDVKRIEFFVNPKRKVTTAHCIHCGEIIETINEDLQNNIASGTKDFEHFKEDHPCQVKQKSL